VDYLWGDPQGEAAELGSKVVELRKKWDQFYNPAPFDNCLVEAKLCVYDLVDDWSAEDSERLDLEASIPIFMRSVEEELLKECPGAAVKWRVSWAKRFKTEGLAVEVPDKPSEESADLADALAMAFSNVYEDVRLEWAWEVIRPEPKKRNSKP
jgi:hypothetical protein